MLKPRWLAFDSAEMIGYRPAMLWFLRCQHPLAMRLSISGFLCFSLFPWGLFWKLWKHYCLCSSSSPSWERINHPNILSWRFSGLEQPWINLPLFRLDLMPLEGGPQHVFIWWWPCETKHFRRDPRINKQWWIKSQWAIVKAWLWLNLFGCHLERAAVTGSWAQSARYPVWFVPFFRAIHYMEIKVLSWRGGKHANGKGHQGTSSSCWTFEPSQYSFLPIQLVKKGSKLRYQDCGFWWFRELVNPSLDLKRYIHWYWLGQHLVPCSVLVWRLLFAKMSTTLLIAVLGSIKCSRCISQDAN